MDSPSGTSHLRNTVTLAPSQTGKHHCDKITLLKDGEGNDVIDISEEAFSYSGSE
jgi:hypothetical protein